MTPDEQEDVGETLGDEVAQDEARKAVAAGTLDNDALGDLLEIAREQARAEVDLRVALNSRAGWLLGFAGVILTLGGAQAQKVLNEASVLGEVDRPLAVAFLAVAVVAVGAAAICALEVLRLRAAVFISDEALKGMSESSLVKGPQAFVRGRMLNNVAEEVVENRKGNEIRRKWLRRATVALVVAAVSLVFHVGVFLERAAENTSTCREPTRIQLVGRGPRASVLERLPALLTEGARSSTPISERGVVNAVATERTVVDFGCFGKGKTKT